MQVHRVLSHTYTWPALSSLCSSVNRVWQVNMHVQRPAGCGHPNTAHPSSVQDLLAACQPFVGRVNMMKTDMAFCDILNPPAAIPRPLVFVIAVVDDRPGKIPALQRLRETLTGVLPKDLQRGFRLEPLLGGKRVHATAVSIFPQSTLANSPGAVTAMVSARLYRSGAK
jgi:hypothetical protein